MTIILIIAIVVSAVSLLGIAFCMGVIYEKVKALPNEPEPKKVKSSVEAALKTVEYWKNSKPVGRKSGKRPKISPPPGWRETS